MANFLPGDGADILRALEAGTAAAADASMKARIASDQPSLGAGPANFGNPFTEIRIDLSALSASTPYVVNTGGMSLNFRRAGSPPGARLNVLGLSDFAPGDRIYAPFNQLSFIRSLRSARKGFAILEASTRPDAFLVESADRVGGAPAPVYLLGTYIGGAAFTTLLTTDPISDTPGFEVTGWKRLRVIIDTRNDGANYCSTFDLVPWFQRADSTGTDNQWLEQGTLRVSVPAPDNSRGATNRYVVVMIDIAPIDEATLGDVNLQHQMQLTAANVVGGGTLGAIVQGVE